MKKGEEARTDGARVVELPRMLGLRSIEVLLAEGYADWERATELVFDLRRVEWIGTYPAALFFSAIAALAAKSIPVAIELDRQSGSPQVRKVLGDYGILSAIQRLGVRLQYVPEPTGRQGLPLTVLQTPHDRLWPALQAAEGRLAASAPSTTRSAVIREAFSVVLYELVENSYLHAASASPYYAVALATSTGPRNDRGGMITVFPEGTPYVEVLTGDLGPGIDTTIRNVVPAEYRPAFGRGRTAHERAILFAFEFSSTRDPQARKQRLSRLLEDDKVDPARIASGLYCVVDVARTLGGQLIVRTPNATLGIDFSREAERPTVAGRRELGLPDIGTMPGTHCVLRLPLAGAVAKTERSRSKSVVPISADRIEVVFPFSLADAGVKEHSESLHAAMKTIDERLQRLRSTGGYLLVAGPSFELPSRALSLFLAALLAMDRSRIQVVWLHATASQLVGSQRSESANLREGPAPILYGDLYRNIFRTTTQDPNRAATRLEAGLQQRLIAHHTAELRLVLQSLLDAPSVRHAPGPFLIENQYYTDVFYEIANAFKGSAAEESFAQWAISHVNKPVEIIVIASVTVRRLATAVANLAAALTTVKPTLIEAFSQDSPGEVAFRDLSLQGKRGLVLTDVVCRGERIRATLGMFSGMTISHVLAIVDARAKSDVAQPLSWLSAGSQKTVLVNSVREETITPHVDRPSRPHGQRHEDEHRVFVIDRRTNSPTLYSRTSQAQLSVGALLESPANAGGIVFSGHLEYQAKHYSHFLHFPRFLTAQRNEIASWIASQIAFVDHTFPKAVAGRVFTACIYDPDDRFHWLPQDLASIPQSPTVTKIAHEQLLSPTPPRAASSGPWVMIIPAAASGETARLCIEYVSRQKPTCILLLLIVSRLDSYHSTFWTGITHYRDAPVHVARYLDFPLGSHAPGEGSCPGCAELLSLRRILQRAQEALPQDSRLMKTLSAKVSALTPISLNVATLTGDSHLALTDEDLAHARLASLYEQASTDLLARRELNKMFSHQVEVDRFLEVVSRERSQKAYSVDELRRRLYSGEQLVVDRATQLAETAAPPYRIGRVVNAIAHLMPQRLLDMAPGLLLRYMASPRDFEEICVSLLQTGFDLSSVEPDWPRGDDEIAATAKEVFDATLCVERVARDLHLTSGTSTAEAAGDLWALLARSSQYKEATEYLKGSIMGDAVDWSEISKIADVLWVEWTKTIRRPLQRLEVSPFWGVFSSIEGVPELLSRLERSTAAVQRIGRASAGGEAHDTLRQALRQELATIANASSLLAGALYGFFVNPGQSRSLGLLGPSLLAQSGSTVRIQKSQVVDAPLVFFRDEDLDFICSQILDNWRKHSDGQQAEAGISISFDSKEVALSFWDTIAGNINLKSDGGMRFIQEKLSPYGARLTYTPSDETGKKMLTIHLRRPRRGN
jgi:hypothetical protein